MKIKTNEKTFTFQEDGELVKKETEKETKVTLSCAELEEIVKNHIGFKREQRVKQFFETEEDDDDDSIVGFTFSFVETDVILYQKAQNANPS